MNFQLNPEHRSIMSICVVEDVSNCPLGYTPILRTHDTDQDADLWKDGFFGRKITRYICVSKSQGRPEYVISAIQIIPDKEMPPEGFSLIQHTVDTNQKAMRKKQLCYALGHYRSNVDSIVEIAIFSKLSTKDIVNGFCSVGDFNGMHICVRNISANTRLTAPSLGYGVSPTAAGLFNSMYPDVQQTIRDMSISSPGNSFYGASNPTSPSFMYNRDSYNTPPHNPPLKHSNTLTQWSDVEGVPFVLHEELQSKYRNANLTSSSRLKPTINIKTEVQIEAEYGYDFMTERSILITNGS